MIKNSIPYDKLMVFAAVIVATAALSGYMCAKGDFVFLIVAIPVIVVCMVRMIKVYDDIVKRLTFILDAVKNNDYSFRFVENSRISKHALVNTTLNSIKDILDSTKLQIKEKEEYFKQIIECANIGIIIVTENGAVKQINSYALHIVGLFRLSHINQLQPLGADIYETIRTIRASEQRTVRIATEIGDMSYLLSCSEFSFDNRNLRVISIGNINEVLDRTEADSWEKLTRILTHEIMNSLAPVTSISHTLLHVENDSEAVKQGLKTIHSTSDRLLQFVNSFRKVTRIPTPQKAPFYLSELISEAVSLTVDDTITMEVNLVPADMMLYADRSLMLQVIINLLRNAVDALATRDDERRISVASSIGVDERITIEIANTGAAIPIEVAQNIFTPFFTTKPDGSGIGLAVSRQIVRLHGGMLRLKHNAEGKVTFAITME